MYLMTHMNMRIRSWFDRYTTDMINSMQIQENRPKIVGPYVSETVVVFTCIYLTYHLASI